MGSETITVMDDDGINEEWAERAAIMECDGGLSRVDAVYRATRAIRKKYGILTDKIKQELMKTPRK